MFGGLSADGGLLGNMDEEDNLGDSIPLLYDSSQALNYPPAAGAGARVARSPPAVPRDGEFVSYDRAPQ